MAETLSFEWDMKKKIIYVYVEDHLGHHAKIMMTKNALIAALKKVGINAK